MGNKSREFLEDVVEICGAGSINPQKLYGNRGYSWQLTIYGDAIRRFLPQLKLKVKKRQQELLLRVLQKAQEWRNSQGKPYPREVQQELLEIAREFRELNFRGRRSKLEEIGNAEEIRG